MHFHSLHTSEPLPQQLNNPFSYEPHPLAVTAAREVCRHVESQPQLLADAQRGKMLGVLVVQRPDGETGFLAAYSGLLAGRNDWPFFVPPVFDAQQPDGHFKTTERRISALSAEIANAQQLPTEGYSPHPCPYPTREGSAMRPMYGKNRAAYTDTPALVALKRQRRELSEQLQLWLFGQYRMLNALGQTKDLVQIWRDYHTSPRLQQRFPLPPGGSGDCCAPKLLQHAFRHGLRPVAMAEFWYGESPRGEVRHHGQFYPACRGKCRPILAHMLQGLSVLPESTGGALPTAEPTVIHEDEALLVVAKPGGLLSVPGRTEAPSVQSLLASRYGPVFMPHRLDMDTSGLMVVARTPEAYKHLQQQFYARVIYKRYVALVEGRVTGSGTIGLPLRPDVLDRPRQVVDPLHGKQALTHYEVLRGEVAGVPGCPQPCTLVALTPHTGRTHQLRVHCAHRQGLNAPIVGDALYGHPGPRLFLHAQELRFSHPLTGLELHFEVPHAFF